MLQVFHMDIAKVDRDIAYVAMVVHVCFKILFSTFHLLFPTYVAKCLFGSFICFTHMLKMFYLDVAYVLQWFQVFLSCFCKCFRCTFQIFHLSLDICCKCCIWMFQK
jgi:hypothetical protein